MVVFAATAGAELAPRHESLALTPESPLPSVWAGDDHGGGGPVSTGAVARVIGEDDSVSVLSAAQRDVAGTAAVQSAVLVGFEIAATHHY
jgi:hypothetical protein